MKCGPLRSAQDILTLVLVVFVFTPIIACLSLAMYVVQLAFNWMVTDEQD